MTTVTMTMTRVTRRSEAPVLGLFFALSWIVALTWYRGHSLIWGVDTAFPLNPHIAASYFHIPDAGVAAPDARKLPFILPLMGLLWVWTSLGLPYDATFVQPFLIVALLTISGMSTYLLVRFLFARVGRLAAFGAGLLYMCNLYSLSAIWGAISNLIFEYSLLPMVLLVWLVALRKSSIPLAAAAGVVWALALTPAYITTPIALTDSLLFAAVTVAEMCSKEHRSSRLRVLVCGATAFGVWLVLSLYWIVPLLLYKGDVTARGLETGNPADLIKLNSVPLDKAIRLAGYWAVTGVYQGSAYYPWRSYYLTIGLLVGFSVPLIAGLGLANIAPRLPGAVVSPGERRYLIFFGAMFLLSVLALTGSRAPFGGLKLSMVEHAGLAGPFRSVYQRFGGYAALSCAVLVAPGIATVSRAVLRGITSRYAAFLSTAAATLLIVGTAVLPALPLWTGSAFDSSGLIPSHRIDIPSDYRKIASKINHEPGDFNVIVFPFPKSGNVTALDWAGGSSGYVGAEPLDLLLEKGTVTGDPAAPYIASMVRDVARGGARAIEALRLLNARYVVVHNDANHRYLAGVQSWIGANTARVERNLNETNGLAFAASTDSFTVYRVRVWRRLQLFVLRGRNGHASSLKKGRIVPVPYRADSPFRFHIDAGILRKGDVLVVNHPFDTSWRASGRLPEKVGPGLTGFAISDGSAVEVSNVVDRRFSVVLKVLPAVILLICSAAVFAALPRRRR